MSNDEILQQAIEKAEKNGYRDLADNHVFDIIFSHDFAKAFFEAPHTHKRKIYDRSCPPDWSRTIDDKCRKTWQHHLQEMVLQEDPLKYIERFL